MKITHLKRFSGRELRHDFYPLFINLMKKGFEIEAFLLMLSIWNFARFRYVVRKFKLNQFKKMISGSDSDFRKFQRLNFKTIDFNKYKKEIKRIFRNLSKFPGVEKTGATKLIHLKVPNVFVMWDGYIRKYYGFKNGDANDYFNFLKLMQEKFRDLDPKLIDEHNYKTITEPILRKNRKGRITKKSNPSSRMQSVHYGVKKLGEC